MASANKIIEKLWARQQISDKDVDYDFWRKKREEVCKLSSITPGSVFLVDIYKGCYDFASDNFSQLLGYDRKLLKNIGLHGDMLEDRMHPEDRDMLRRKQIRHGHFIYSQPAARRNDFSTVFQIRMMNANRKYINITSRQRVFQTDNNGKAWIIMGTMDISPDQAPCNGIKYSVIDIRSGNILSPDTYIHTAGQLTAREIEILQMIRNGLLSKEIALKLNVSIHTINNHRKNILSKLGANNSIEAINLALNAGIFD